MCRIQHLAGQVNWTNVSGLLIEMRKCVAQRICGDLEHAVERPIHFHNKKYGACHRQGTKEEYPKNLDAKRLAKDLRSRLEDIPALFARHVPQARLMLKKLLNGHIICEPIKEGGKAGYRFTATGTFDRLLTGLKVINDGGGGQPRRILFWSQNPSPAESDLG